MARRVKMSKISGQVKCRVTFPPNTTRRRLFGEPVQTDEEGNRFADVPAHPNLKQIVRDLHPDWKLGEDFVDLPEDAELMDAPEPRSEGKSRK